VLLRAGTSLAQAELIAWSRERMANYKVPRYMEVFDAFPLNASNKVLKRELAQAAARRVGQG
jgi:acyl-CoA synthetase (AMP-forming)/AMP-acid ligase II